jgi:hypothetical protein
MPSAPAPISCDDRELGSAIAEVEPDADRAAWLQAQLRGVEAACRVLGGEPAGYRELVQRCYEVSVSEVNETQFQRAHELILSGLPGTGSAAERFQAWAATQRVSGERLLVGLKALAREFRARCRKQWDLADGESVRFEMTRGPWAAYAEYKGGLQSVIRFSNELPVMAWWMVELVAHEAYPGHHTEHVFKDVALVRAHNRKEFCAWVYPTPQALIAEGIAMLAPTMLLGYEIEELGAKCLRPLGIDYDTAGSAVVREAHELLIPVAANLTRMSAETKSTATACWRTPESGVSTKTYTLSAWSTICAVQPGCRTSPATRKVSRRAGYSSTVIQDVFLGCSHNSSPQRHSNDKRSPRALPLRSNTGNQRTLSQARAFRAS